MRQLDSALAFHKPLYARQLLEAERTADPAAEGAEALEGPVPYSRMTGSSLSHYHITPCTAAARSGKLHSRTRDTRDRMTKKVSIITLCLRAATNALLSSSCTGACEGRGGGGGGREGGEHDARLVRGYEMYEAASPNSRVDERQHYRTALRCAAFPHKHAITPGPPTRCK